MFVQLKLKILSVCYSTSLGKPCNFLSVTFVTEYSYLQQNDAKCLCKGLMSISLHNNGSEYRNDPKFSDRWVWANSADPDQTAPRGAV